MLPDTELGRPLSKQLGIGGLLAHEMFHEWDGPDHHARGPRTAVYWFTEGFTDFYTRRLLLRGGLIGTEEYLESINGKLADLLASPVCNAPNEHIRADFWSDNDVKRLPYLRGRHRGADRRCSHAPTLERSYGLDDFMRALVRDARATGDATTRMRSCSASPSGVDAGTVEHLRAVVCTGATPRIEPSLLEPCFELRVESLAFVRPRLRLGWLRAGPDAFRESAPGRRRSGGSPQRHEGARLERQVRRSQDAGRVEAGPGEADSVITYLPAGKPIPTHAVRRVPGVRGCEKL